MEENKMPSSITVTVLTGPAAGASCSREGAERLVLGRIKTGTALACKDPMVSSMHVELSFADGTWFARDVHSSNGTRLNDGCSDLLKGQAYPLRSGDVLRLGPDTTVRVEFGGADDAAADAADDENLTVEQKLTADAERLTARIKAAAEASVKQLRQDWAAQRRALQSIAQC